VIRKGTTLMNAMPQRGRVSTGLVAGYTALMAVFGVVVFAAPAWSAVGWASIGLLSAGAVVLGARLHTPADRTPWWLLAAAIVAMATGDAVYAAGTRDDPGSSPIMADVCYLAMFPLLTAGLVQMTRRSVVLPDRSRLLDLLTFACAMALGSWVLLVDPSLSGAGLDNADKSALVAYALGDLLVLITTVRLVVAARRSPALVLLALGAAGMLLADVAYALAQAGGGWLPGGPAELGYLLFYLAWGAAALQPSMAELTAPADARAVRLSGWWIALLGLSLAVPPGTLLVESITGGVRHGVLIAVVSGVMTVLVITRLTDAITAHRRAVARERELREACGALLAVTDTDALETALRAAVGRLMAPEIRYEIVFTVSDGDLAGVGALGRQARLLSTRMLSQAQRDRVAGFETALLCPLVLDRTAGVGALIVAAEPSALTAAHDAVEVLAAHATLTLERIALTAAVNRRDSDRYLRTVVRHASDVMLIVGPDGRIRYASPSLATVLGIEPPPSAELRDIVHPDDHQQIWQTLDRVQHAAEPDGARDTWSLRRPDGSRVLVEVRYRDLRHDRMVRGFVITLRDITDSRRAEQEQIRRAFQASPGGKNRTSGANKFS